MLTGLYSAATAMDTAQKHHEIIARDLAHVSVPGYRGTTATFRNFDQAYRDSLQEVSAQGHGVMIDKLHTNFAGGPVERTGRQLDVAIDGNGLFEVSGDNGRTFTRNGTFFLSSEGVLVTAAGNSVMGEGGEIRVPRPFSETDVHINPEGQVRVGSTTVGKLRLVEFAEMDQLDRAGTTSFRAPDGVEPIDSNSRVQQGYREKSNVSAVEQLVRMIVNMRQHDAAKQSITKIDESMGRLTNPQS